MIRAPQQSKTASRDVRPGVTLIEVLVSIFIMGIGLLALLTLFPLGALTMDQAIKADRSAAAARNAYANGIAKGVRHDTTFYSLPAKDDYTNPGAPWPQISRVPGAHRGSTYPIYVDVFGSPFASSGQPLGATASSPGIPRRGVSFVQNQREALLWFSLLDDMAFNEDGLPKVIPGTQTVPRTNRYTWALMLRRVSSQERDWVEMAVVVYHGRPLQVAGGEQAYTPITFDPNSSSVRVEWDPASQERPAVRKGGWILDATVLDANGAPAPHGYFYRVVQVTDVAAATPGWQAVVLELQDRPRKFTDRGVLVAMEHVLEVFDEGLGWKP